jgi:adenylosuccinate lyase
VIERYTLPEMGHVWSEAHKYELWCKVETLVLEAHAAAGVVPADCVEPVRNAPPPTPEAVAAIEAVTQHDVIAFLSAWADNTTPREAAAWVHFGMTSSDLLDTALGLQLVEASDILLDRADRLVAALRDHALTHRRTLRVGRTHGIHGEPDLWGHRVADFAFGMARSRDRLRRAREAVAVMAISGAVGTYSNIDPAVEARVAAALGLRPADVSTQVVLRDGIAEWVSALAITATVCEAVALEVRHGQRTEVRELSEPFGAGQKGSSAMPHKRNPILSERLTGLARVLRGYLGAGLEDVALWHERDISHSSVERVILPDACLLTYYVLRRCTGLIDNLVVHPERMLANVTEGSLGLVFSQPVLLALVASGMSRDAAYRVVQRDARIASEERRAFRSVLEEDPEVTLDGAALDEAFSVSRSLRHVDRFAHALKEVEG